MAQRPEVTARFPPSLKCLFQPSRYKIIYGGRGGGKSWAIARALLIQGYQAPIRVLCARELQNSISDSVHKLLSDQIAELKLDGFYRIEKATIYGANGTEFRFAGIKTNIGAVKSFEGITHAWVEEAANVSKASWETLIPTIRRDGSEIWVSFNPSLETDETYQRFVVNPPTDAVVVKQGWRENPWFPDVLRLEMEDLRDRDPDAYLNVYEGHCRQMLDGAVYAAELRQATEEGRITSVPYDATKPVHTFWDLGWSDNTSIWFAQTIAFEYRLIDYMQDNQKALQHYIVQMQNKGYVYGTDHLPHDARAKTMGTGRSIEEMMRAAGRKVKIIPALSLMDGINAARTVFGQCWFDETKCSDGLQCLRHYRYETDAEAATLSRKPVHDWSSHGSDAFRYMSLALRESRKPMSDDPWSRRRSARRSGRDWMAA